MNNEEYTNKEQHENTALQTNNLITWWQSGPLKEQTKKAAVIALIFFLLLIAFGFFASRSLPGSALYGVKTGVLEGLGESVQFSTKDKAQYQVTRMETRLQEIKSLAQEETVAQEEMDAFKEMVFSHQAKLSELINLPDNGMSYPDTLFILNSFASVAAAIEGITENAAGMEALGEEMEDVRRESVNLFSDTVDRFVERETPQNIYTFITQQLQEVSKKLDNTDLGEDVVDDAQVYINRVAPAMEKGNFPKAIAAIAEALRFIEVEEYGGRPQKDTRTDATSTEESVGTTTTEGDEIIPTSSASSSFIFTQ